MPHNLSHFLKSNQGTHRHYQQEGNIFPQPFPNITLPVSQLPYSAQTHSSVIITIISQGHLVIIKHVGSNISRDGNDFPISLFLGPEIQGL